MSSCVDCNIIHFPYFQQTHQKNQVKDTIDVEEPEGMLLLLERKHFEMILLLQHYH